jgi:hypothetical protein
MTGVRRTYGRISLSQRLICSLVTASHAFDMVAPSAGAMARLAMARLDYN